EGKSGITHLGRRHELGIAAGHDVPHPQTLLSVSLVHYIHHVLAIRRDRRQKHLAGIRELYHAHVPERHRSGITEPAQKPSVGAIDSRSDHQQAEDGNQPGAALVLLSGLQDGHTAARKYRWTAGLRRSDGGGG